jgi:hypothetical protein
VKTPSTLVLFCPHCEESFALTANEIDQAKEALVDQMKRW